MSYNPSASAGGNIYSDGDVALSNPIDGQVLEYNASISKWQNQAPATAVVATTSSTGTVQLAGDLAGTAVAPTVAKINGISVASSPTSGQALVATSSTAATWQSITSSSSQTLTPTSVKTSGYTASVSDLVIVDASGGTVTITLPSNSADKSLIGIKLIATSGSNVATVAAGGSDVFNKSAGSTSLFLATVNQAFSLQYSSSANIWYAEDSLSLASLDSRYIGTSQKSAANGIASLNSSTLVPTSQLATGTANGTTYLRGDQTWATVSTAQNALQVQAVSIIAIGSYTGIPSNIDTLTITNGMTVLLTAEIGGINNGLWTVNAGGAWTRPSNYATGSDATGSYVMVQGGAQLTGTIWALRGLAPNVVDTNGTHWQYMRSGSERGFVNAYSVYYAGDTVILNTNVKVIITTSVQAGSSGFISASNYVIIQYLQTFDIRYYGAKVDATTDDTAAIQAAITAAANSTATGTSTGIGTSTPGLGGVVFFPSGTTRISATLDLPSNVHLRGTGWSSSCIQLLPNSNCHMITTHRSTGSGNSNAFWCSVTNMMLDGRKNNQGAVLTDCVLIPGTTTITSVAGTFAANGTLIQGVGILPGSTIVSGGGTGSIVISQPLTYSALQQAPGTATIYQGGTTDALGSVVPWCGIYHETNPYNTQQNGDNQFDPTHLFSHLRIYYVCGDGVRIHGRSDVTLNHIKVTQAVGNGFTVDFDTKLSECMTEFTTGHALHLPGHSSVQVADCKFYNSYAHGIYMVGGAGELTFAAVDLQQINLDGIHMESQQGVIFNGTILQAGFVNASSSISAASNATWVANHSYANFRTSSIPSTVNPVSVNGYVYACYVPGTSGSSEPTWPTTVGQTVTDGGVIWVCLASLPASVSLLNSSNSIIEAICQKDNNALRITGSSAQNTIQLAHISTVTGQRDVSSDSMTLVGSGNMVIINGRSSTSVLSLLNDVSVVTPATGQYLSYNGTAWANSAPPGIFYANVFGDGSDGAITLDGTATYTNITKVGSVYTLGKDINASAVTINGGSTLVMNGWKILCRGTVTNNGTISAVGNAAALGVAGATTTQSSLGGGQAGGAGNIGAGSAGTGGGFGVGTGGAGGAGASGAAGSQGYAANGSTYWFKNPQSLLVGSIAYGGTVYAIKGGAGGGGGGGDGSNKGGGGGGGGGIIAIIAPTVINAGTMTVAGGAGAAGVAGNAGGGGGGGGGLIVTLTTSAWTNSGTTISTGGTAGAGLGTGATASAGSAGNVVNFVMQ